MPEYFTQLTTLASAVVVTASGNSASGGDNTNRKCDNLSVHIAASAVSGTTPSLTAEVQWSNDNVTFLSADTPDTFTAITAAKTVCKQFAVKGLYFQVKYTVTGTTPSFTLTISALNN